MQLWGHVQIKVVERDGRQSAEPDEAHYFSLPFHFTNCQINLETNLTWIQFENFKVIEKSLPICFFYCS